jgi:asparagine synthetase B (glutamine-hydrolysing)
VEPRRFESPERNLGLVIWDVKRKRLTSARDPFGIKLVYYKIEAVAHV